MKEVIYIIRIGGLPVYAEGFVDGMVDELIVLLDEERPRILVSREAAFEEFTFGKSNIHHKETFSVLIINLCKGYLEAVTIVFYLRWTANVDFIILP